MYREKSINMPDTLYKKYKKRDKSRIIRRRNKWWIIKELIIRKKVIKQLNL